MTVRSSIGKGGSAVYKFLQETLTDPRLVGLGGKRGLAAKLGLGKGVLKGIDKFTDSGRKIDPAIVKPGSPYAGTWFQLLHGMGAGMLRRMDIKKALQRLNKEDVRGVNEALVSGLKDPVKLKEDLYRVKSSIATATDYGGKLAKDDAKFFAAFPDAVRKYT